MREKQRVGIAPAKPRGRTPSVFRSRQQANKSGMGKTCSREGIEEDREERASEAVVRKFPLIWQWECLKGLEQMMT